MPEKKPPRDPLPQTDAAIQYLDNNREALVQQLQQRMLVTGREKGCGQCLWANEFEISQ